MGGLLILCLPGYGLAITMALFCLLRFKPLPQGDLLQEFKEHTSLPLEKGWSASKVEKVEDAQNLLLSQLQVEPLIDMLKTDDLQLKRAVIEAMARKRGSHLIAKIKECLNDPHPEIYQYAMAKLDQLQEEFALEISRRMEKVNKNPRSLQALQDLSLIYGEYLESGLLDKTLREFYTQKLINIYEKILRLSPERLTVQVNLGKIFLRKGLDQEALELFKRAVKMEPGNLEAHFGLVESYYNIGMYREMLKEAHLTLLSCITKDTSHKGYLKLLEWWVSERHEVKLGMEVKSA